MKKIFFFGVDDRNKENNEIILSNQIAFLMAIISFLWIIGYSMILPNIIFIPIVSFLISIGILGLNYFNYTVLSRFFTAISYTSIFSLAHSLVVNESEKFFVPIYIVLISFSLFTWNLFSKDEKFILHSSFIFNVFLICGQHTFNTAIISAHPYDMASNPVLYEINYISAVFFLYFSLYYSHKKLTKKNNENESLINQLQQKSQDTENQNLQLKQQQQHIQQQQKQIENQNQELQNHINILEETKQHLIEKEAETKSINNAIYSNFLIAEYDLDGKIIDINDKFLELIGLPKDEVIHQQQEKISHLDLNTEIEHQIAFMRFWTKIRKGIPLSKQHKFQLPHKTIWVQCTFAPLLNEQGNTVKILSINQDISHTKEQQLFMKNKNTCLINNGRTLMKLSRDVDVHLGNQSSSFIKISKLVAQNLNVHRVSIWKYNAKAKNIVCEKLYKLENDSFESGSKLTSQVFPSYFDALLHEKIIVAKDALTNDDTKEFRESYLEPLNIKSMLDMPIIYDGKLWGVICCEHKYEKRNWIQEDATFLKSCCDIISLSITTHEKKLVNQQLTTQREEIIHQNNELKQQKEELITQREHIEEHKIIIEDKNKKLLDSLSYAKRIQDAILPPQELFKDNFTDYFILYQPKDIVSGDFYWVTKKGNKILVAAVDCTGHGVPGALVSIVGNNALNRAVNEFHLTTPSDILNKVNDIITHELNQHSEIEVYDGMDISLICIDSENQTMEFSGAYNPLYIIQNGEFQKICADRKSIGFNLEYYTQEFTNHSLSIEKDQTFYLFSDGFPDQFGGDKNKKFSYKRLKNTLMNHNHLPLNEQKELLQNTFKQWKKGHEQIDDILIMGLKI